MALHISVIVTVMSVLTGFMEVSGEKLLLMRTFGATKLQMLRMVILPGSVPSIISTIKINVGMTWVGVIVGEYLVSKAGLGYLIVYGGQVFKLDLVMASILILAVVAAAAGASWTAAAGGTSGGARRRRAPRRGCKPEEAAPRGAAP